jgi:hypothetical protein
VSRRLYRPRAASVRAGADGIPVAVGRSQVDAVREQWLVEDRWWTGRPLRRLYFELVTAGGASRVVFHDLESDRWYAQGGA